MSTGTIIFNKNTALHADTLSTLGYRTAQDTQTRKGLLRDVITVEHEGIVESSKEQPIDISTQDAQVATLRATVAAKMAFSYGSWFKLPSGKVVQCTGASGYAPAKVLGSTSCLIVKVPTKAKPKAVVTPNNSLLDLIVMQSV